jgi:hypothetical protein
LTNDSGVDCFSDAVWFSPSCRANTSECVPLMLQYGFDFAMQIAFFLNMPLAIVLVKPDADFGFGTFYKSAKAGRFLFNWFQPDDSLVDDAGNLPVNLNLPRSNELEQLAGVFKTARPAFKPRNFGWRKLPEVDRLVSFLASKVSLYNLEMDSMMRSSRRLKDSGQTDNLLLSRSIACEWVLASPNRWAPWIPAICPPGSFADGALSSCAPCPAGSFCLGAVDAGAACPAGFYCLAGASAATQCPAGWTTGGPGVASPDGCTSCAEGFQRIGPSCAATAAVLGTTIGAALALVCASVAVAAFAMRWQQRKGGSGVGDEEEDPGRRLRVAMEGLRDRLGLRQRDGFVLSNEAVQRRYRRYRMVVVQRSNLEAAGARELRPRFSPVVAGAPRSGQIRVCAAM